MREAWRVWMRCLCSKLVDQSRSANVDAEQADDELIGWDSTQVPGALLSKQGSWRWWCEAGPAAQPADYIRKNRKANRQLSSATRALLAASCGRCDGLARLGEECSIS